MPKCPKCKAEIDHLEFDVTSTCSSILKEEYVKAGKWGNNCLEAYDGDTLSSNVEFDNFRCPECQECLFTKGGNEEEQAINFLKGSK